MAWKLLRDKERVFHFPLVNTSLQHILSKTDYSLELSSVSFKKVDKH